MKVTKGAAARKISAYLRRELSLAELVDWAETAVMDGEFESAAVARVVARLGVADVRAFGLEWDDCQALLKKLGYAARVRVVAA